jgi:hypothetical protein
LTKRDKQRLGTRRGDEDREPKVPLISGGTERKGGISQVLSVKRLINVLPGTLSFRVQTKLPQACGSLARYVSGKF